MTEQRPPAWHSWRGGGCCRRQMDIHARQEAHRRQPSLGADAQPDWPRGADEETVDVGLPSKIEQHAWQPMLRDQGLAVGMDEQDPDPSAGDHGSDGAPTVGHVQEMDRRVVPAEPLSELADAARGNARRLRLGRHTLARVLHHAWGRPHVRRDLGLLHVRFRLVRGSDRRVLLGD